MVKSLADVFCATSGSLYRVSAVFAVLKHAAEIAVFLVEHLLHFLFARRGAWWSVRLSASASRARLRIVLGS